ncbi:MAG TPA: UDP-N-acetylmuramate dehydrogenase [Terriglobales bacterium]|nr:UDP-N-acetylmuramate dehydrogenase [Terriglobales bacterium]
MRPPLSFATLASVTIQEQVPLAPLTTLGVGGPARYFVECVSHQDVCEAVQFARLQSLPIFVLGGGSNLVVADEGFAGLVLKVAVRGISASHLNGNQTLFDVGAGEDWDNFVNAAVLQNCSGLECLSGIPGTVGGTPVQNVGAYGQEVSATIRHVEAFDLETGDLRVFPNSECGFAYRTSRFNTVDRGRYIILRVCYALRRGGQPELAYADLKKYFAGREQPSLAEIREAVINIRRSKGMVLDQSDADSHSAGSFFKNPVLSDEQFQALEERAATRGLKVPNYPALSSQRKVSAAWLVEQSGFSKGTARGPVGISSKHSLALINRGGAKAADIIALKNDVQRAVADQFGIHLVPEPVFLGFSD